MCSNFYFILFFLKDKTNKYIIWVNYRRPSTFEQFASHILKKDGIQLTTKLFKKQTKVLNTPTGKSIVCESQSSSV